MSALLEVVLPAAMVVVAGWAVGRRISLDLPTLTRLTLYLLAPALTLDSMYRSDLPAADGARLFGAFALATGLLFLLVAVVSRGFRIEPPVRKSLIATTLFPNSGNLGLSLTLLALGQPGLERAVVAYVASALLVFGLGPGLVSGEGFRKGLRTTLRLPLIWALVAGLALRVSGITLPVGVADGVHLLGQATVPVLLLTLGLQISRTRFTPRADDVFAAGLRLGGGPAAAYLAGRALGLDHLALQVLVLQCATPTAVNALLIASEFGGDAPRAARAVVLSSLLAFATLPIVMALMGIRS
jgi:predicted permease